MAATAVYAKISSIPTFAQGTPFVIYSNINATTSEFHLLAGKYSVQIIGATFGTVTLQILGPNGSTYLIATTAFSANGFAIVDLPDGQYRLLLA